MTKLRLPIASRLFIAVLMTTLIISLVGLLMLHFTMQKGFSRYVAEVEMQRLDVLVDGLANQYQRYGTWQDAMNASVRSGVVPYDRVKKRWLRYQYELAMRRSLKRRLEERYSRGNPANGSYLENGSLASPLSLAPLLMDDQDAGRAYLPPFQPSGPPPIMPGLDRLELGKRLVLYDGEGNYLVGLRSAEDLPRRSIKLNGKTIGYLGLQPALDPEDTLSVNFFSAQSRYLIWIGLSCFLVSAIVSSLLARNFRRPIGELLETASELTHGNYQQHIEIRRNDELGDLAQSINQLSTILYQHEQSRRQWVADTSHELRTPISVLQAQIEAMLDGVREATPAHLQGMQRQVLTLKKLVQDLNELAKADVGQLQCHFRLCNPWNIVLQEVESFEHKFAAKQLHVNVVPPVHEIELNIDPDRIRQVIANFLENTRRYTNDNGELALSVEITDSQWKLHVDDSPPGLSDEELERLGERFYRVDSSRNRATGGSGLGLALSRQIAEAHDGSIVFDHSPLGGLRATLCLPIKPTQ
ncbi:sensor histidine kinase efflux regulator BaeS [Alkanindiges illinoisensis]|uniref:sensor histidine kinase efflux regulator BaeS n=1 Tax=Alkanindiges illinoisensis TaxID=197183 RepID=UPI000555BD09|nr:sensor histidine kinase efflux regulator BaeS [Alkanindiges illinoisensis]